MDKSIVIIIKKQLNILLTGSGILLLGIIYFSYSPVNSGFFPQCPVKYLSGYSCPGCGSQRAIHELLHLNFKKAFEYNALLMVAVPYLLTGFVWSTENMKSRYAAARQFLFGKRAMAVFFSIVILFTILRNI